MNDGFFMQRCEALAVVAAQRQESPVGAVVVLDGQIIGGATSAYPVLTAKNIAIWSEPPVVEFWRQGT